MNVGIVYQYYQGHSEPGHSIVYDIAHHLDDRGHRVYVVAGEMGYMRRSVASRRPWYRRLFRKERDGRITVIRTYTYPDLHRNYLSRLFSFISFSLSCACGLLWIPRPKVVLASSPPLFPIFSGGLVCKLRRIPLVFEVRDLWPDSAVQMGILRSRWQIRFMAWMERWLYRHSHRISARTEGIKHSICSRGWHEEKVVFIPCGVDGSRYYPDSQAGDRMRKLLGWEKRKIVLYFGALGEANNLPVILNAANRLRSRDDILFVLIGDGMKRQTLEEQRSAMGLKHVRILPPVPKQQARDYLNAADICMVTLQDIPLFEGAIPNKLLEYLACGKPVICGIRGEAERIVRASQAGVVFEPNDDARLAGLIEELTADDARAAAMAANGPGYIRKYFSALDMRNRMETVLAEAAGCAGTPSFRMQAN